MRCLNCSSEDLQFFGADDLADGKELFGCKWCFHLWTKEQLGGGLMPFGNTTTKPKGPSPFFTGLVEEREGKTRVSLWPTDSFHEYMKKLSGG